MREEHGTPLSTLTTMRVGGPAQRLVTAETTDELVDAVREAGGHAMVTTRSELATVEGEPICTATSTIVIRGGE